MHAHNLQTPPQHSTVSASPRNNTISPIWSRPNLGRLVTARIARVPIARLPVILAAVGHGASVAIVGVDAAQNASVDGHDVVHDDVARAAVA